MIVRGVSSKVKKKNKLNSELHTFFRLCSMASLIVPTPEYLEVT